MVEAVVDGAVKPNPPTGDGAFVGPQEGNIGSALWDIYRERIAWLERRLGRMDVSAADRERWTSELLRSYRLLRRFGVAMPAWFFEYEDGRTDERIAWLREKLSDGRLSLAEMKAYERELLFLLELIAAAGSGEKNTEDENVVSKSEVIVNNNYLTPSEMEINATYIYYYLRKEGWSKEAIAALMGNMEVESTINPGLWQNRNEGNKNAGFGLVQWTPPHDLTLWEWAEREGLDPFDIDTQLKRLLLEATGEIYHWQYWRTEGYSMTFAEFTISTLAVEELAVIFMLNYERPNDKSLEKQQERKDKALKWFNFFDRS